MWESLPPVAATNIGADIPAITDVGTAATMGLFTDDTSAGAAHTTHSSRSHTRRHSVTDTRRSSTSAVADLDGAHTPGSAASLYESYCATVPCEGLSPPPATTSAQARDWHNRTGSSSSSPSVPAWQQTSPPPPQSQGGVDAESSPHGQPPRWPTQGAERRARIGASLPSLTSSLSSHPVTSSSPAPASSSPHGAESHQTDQNAANTPSVTADAASSPTTAAANWNPFDNPQPALRARGLPSHTVLSGSENPFGSPTSARRTVAGAPPSQGPPRTTVLLSAAPPGTLSPPGHAPPGFAPAPPVEVPSWSHGAYPSPSHSASLLDPSASMSGIVDVAGATATDEMLTSGAWPRQHPAHPASAEGGVPSPQPLTSHPRVGESVSRRHVSFADPPEHSQGVPHDDSAHLHGLAATASETVPATVLLSPTENHRWTSADTLSHRDPPCATTLLPGNGRTVASPVTAAAWREEAEAPDASDTSDVHRHSFYQNNSSMARSFYFPDGMHGVGGGATEGMTGATILAAASSRRPSQTMGSPGRSPTPSVLASQQEPPRDSPLLHSSTPPPPALRLPQTPTQLPQPPQLAQQRASPGTRISVTSTRTNAIVAVPLAAAPPTVAAHVLNQSQPPSPALPVQSDIASAVPSAGWQSPGGTSVLSGPVTNHTFVSPRSHSFPEESAGLFPAQPLPQRHASFVVAPHPSHRTTPAAGIASATTAATTSVHGTSAYGGERPLPVRMSHRLGISQGSPLHTRTDSPGRSSEAGRTSPQPDHPATLCSTDGLSATRMAKQRPSHLQIALHHTRNDNASTGVSFPGSLDGHVVSRGPTESQDRSGAGDAASLTGTMMSGVAPNLANSFYSPTLAASFFDNKVFGPPSAFAGCEPEALRHGLPELCTDPHHQRQGSDKTNQSDETTFSGYMSAHSMSVLGSSHRAAALHTHSPVTYPSNPPATEKSATRVPPAGVTVFTYASAAAALVKDTANANRDISGCGQDGVGSNPVSDNPSTAGSFASGQEMLRSPTPISLGGRSPRLAYTAASPFVQQRQQPSSQAIRGSDPRARKASGAGGAPVVTVPPAKTASSVTAPVIPPVLMQLQKQFEAYRQMKGQCTEAYLTRIERTVDGFLARYYNPRHEGSKGSQSGAALAGGRPSGRGSALIGKAGAKLSSWFKQATANINGTAGAHATATAGPSPALVSALPQQATPPPPPSTVATASYSSHTNTGSASPLPAGMAVPTGSDKDLGGPLSYPTAVGADTLEGSTASSTATSSLGKTDALSAADNAEGQVPSVASTIAGVGAKMASSVSSQVTSGVGSPFPQPGIHRSPPAVPLTTETLTQTQARAAPMVAPPPPPTPEPPQYPLYPLRYTVDAVPEDYIDARPSEATLRAVELNYPIILHALKHLLPPPDTSSSLEPKPTPHAARAVLPEERRSSQVEGTQGSSPSESGTTASSYGSPATMHHHASNGKQAQAWFPNQPTMNGEPPSQQQTVPPTQPQSTARELAVSLTANPSASIPYRLQDHASLCEELIVPTIKSIWAEYLQPLQATIEEHIAATYAVVQPILANAGCDASATIAPAPPGFPNASLVTPASQDPHTLSPLTAQQQQQCLRIYNSLQSDAEYISTIAQMDQEFIQEYELERAARLACQQAHPSQMQDTAMMMPGSPGPGAPPPENQRKGFVGRLRGAGAGAMSDYVPVYGLIMSRLHRLEMEHRTVLELWDPAVKIGKRA